MLLFISRKRDFMEMAEEVDVPESAERTRCCSSEGIQKEELFREKVEISQVHEISPHLQDLWKRSSEI